MEDQDKKIEEVTETAAETAEEKVEEKAAEVEEKAEEKAEEKKEEKKEKKAPKEGKKLSAGLIAGICGGAVALIAIVLVVIAIISGSGAISKYTAKDYAGAYSASKMAWFMAKSDKDVVAIGYVDNVLCKEGKYLEGARILAKVDQDVNAKALEKVYKDNPYLGMCVEGAVVQFATWEQDGDNSSEEPIEWVVLEVDTGSQPKALLLSTKVIGSISARSKTEGNTSYALSDIHGWCETDFYNTISFDESIKGKILMINVHTEPSSTGVDSGEDVKAHVFAPSLQDIQKYLQGNEEMEQYIRAEGTPAIKKAGSKVTSKGFSGYWLRNAGESEGFASAVTDKGDVIEGSGMSSSHGVRPMMWVSLG